MVHYVFFRKQRMELIFTKKERNEKVDLLVLFTILCHEVGDA